MVDGPDCPVPAGVAPTNTTAERQPVHPRGRGRGWHRHGRHRHPYRRHEGDRRPATAVHHDPQLHRHPDGGRGADAYGHGGAAFADNAGDYFHYKVPWNATGSAPNNLDAPNGIPGGSTASTIFTGGFNEQITAWCASCHTRYWAWSEPTGIRPTAAPALPTTRLAPAIACSRISTAPAVPVVAPAPRATCRMARAWR